jgi:histidine triad (HIT) family protein
MTRRNGGDAVTDQCIFCKIATGQIPTEPVWENEEFMAFHDLHPQAPVHVLLMPKAHYPTLLDVTDADVIGRAMLAVGETARRLGVADSGFRAVINCGPDGGQVIYHLHVHIMAGRRMADRQG